MSVEMSRGEPQQELLNELRGFVNGATAAHSSKVDQTQLAKTAITLLKTFPAARDSVLEHLRSVFEAAVSQHVRRNQSQGSSKAGSSSHKSGIDETTILEVHTVISSFLKSSAEAWSPVISTWSLDLLGYLSGKYAKQMRDIPHNAGLNECLQGWMACQATRTLVEITTLCLSSLMHADTDACISALLDTSVKHGPSFDWVVAHIGSCYPDIVITRVIICGLREFSLSDSSEHEVQYKLESVVGILGHLAGSHSNAIKDALRELFKNSLCEHPNREQQATVPYIMKLASHSNMLLESLVADLRSLLTPETLELLVSQTHFWVGKGLWFWDLVSLRSTLVGLCIQCHGRCGTDLVLMLIRFASGEDGVLRPDTSELCSILLELVLLELGNRQNVPLLASLCENVSSLLPSLTDRNQQKTRFTVKFLTAVAKEKGPRVTQASLKHIIANSSSSCQLAVAVQILSEMECEHPQAMAEAFQDIIREGQVNGMQNLCTLCKMQQPPKALLVRTRISLCGKDNVEGLCSLLNRMDLAELVLELLTLIPVSEEISVRTLYILSSSVTKYYFSLLSTAENEIKKITGVQICEKILKGCCQYQCIQLQVLRALVEGAISPGNCALFGGQISSVKVQKQKVNLLDENFKYSQSMMLPQRHSMFHAGVIGRGLRSLSDSSSAQRTAQIKLNKQLLINTTQAVMVPSRATVEDMLPGEAMPTVESMTQLSLFLVELISPDVMYNGLPWPEEEFMKVTIERDLEIRRTLKEHPVVWDFLYVVATVRPALCSCSVILRAVCATLLQEWNSYQDSDRLQDTRHLLELLSLGQLVPPPLNCSHLPAILQELSPQEVRELLMDIWNYMRENVPAMSLFSKDPVSGVCWRDFNTQPPPDRRFTHRLRLILVNNMDKIGHLYPHFFPMGVAEPS